MTQRSKLARDITGPISYRDHDDQTKDIEELYKIKQDVAEELVLQYSGETLVRLTETINGNLKVTDLNYTNDDLTSTTETYLGKTLTTTFIYENGVFKGYIVE